VPDKLAGQLDCSSSLAKYSLPGSLGVRFDSTVVYLLDWLLADTQHDKQAAMLKACQYRQTGRFDMCVDIPASQDWLRGAAKLGMYDCLVESRVFLMQCLDQNQPTGPTNHSNKFGKLFDLPDMMPGKVEILGCQLHRHALDFATLLDRSNADNWLAVLQRLEQSQLAKQFMPHIAAYLDCCAIYADWELDYVLPDVFAKACRAFTETWNLPVGSEPSGSSGSSGSAGPSGSGHDSVFVKKQVGFFDAKAAEQWLSALCLFGVKQPAIQRTLDWLHDWTSDKQLHKWLGAQFVLFRTQPTEPAKSKLTESKPAEPAKPAKSEPTKSKPAEQWLSALCLFGVKQPAIQRTLDWLHDWTSDKQLHKWLGSQFVLFGTQPTEPAKSKLTESKPAEPAKPAKSEPTKSKPAESGQSGQPAKRAKPSQPSQPFQPSQPAKPATSGQDSQPTDSGCVGQTGQSGQSAGWFVFDHQFTCQAAKWSSWLANLTVQDQETYRHKNTKHNWMASLDCASVDFFVDYLMACQQFDGSQLIAEQRKLIRALLAKSGEWLLPLLPGNLLYFGMHACIEQIMAVLLLDQTMAGKAMLQVFEKELDQKACWTNQADVLEQINKQFQANQTNQTNQHNQINQPVVPKAKHPIYLAELGFFNAFS